MKSRFGSPVLDASARLLAPFMWLFAAYVLVHGHESPGGGFQAGVILAGSIIMLRLVRGDVAHPGVTSRDAVTLACAGTLCYGGIGIATLLAGGNFLDYGVLPLPMDPVQVRVIGTLGIEAGVMLGVTGVLVLIFDVLAPWGDGTL
ncbi:MAG: sodium:proton antiporter [Acidobacteria bacterium]|nr:sodium:proton antiporter [Acidobacteriota bacterium]